MNFTTATSAELAAAGYTITTCRSQRTKKNRKSLFGVRPSMNKGGRRAPQKATEASLKVQNGEVQG